MDFIKPYDPDMTSSEPLSNQPMVGLAFIGGQHVPDYTTCMSDRFNTIPLGYCRCCEKEIKEEYDEVYERTLWHNTKTFYSYRLGYCKECAKKLGVMDSSYKRELKLSVVDKFTTDNGTHTRYSDGSVVEPAYEQTMA